MSDQYLTPEMAQKLADISYAPQEQSGLQQQLDQAIALRNGQQVQRLSPEAQRYEGIGDLAREIGSFAQENRLRGQISGLTGQQKSAYGEYLKQLFRAQALRNGGAQPAPEEQQAWTPGDAMSGVGPHG